jgi:hypothetical protein
VEVLRRHDFQPITCTARMPGVDKESAAGTESHLAYNGKEVIYSQYLNLDFVVET